MGVFYHLWIVPQWESGAKQNTLRLKVASNLPFEKKMLKIIGMSVLNVIRTPKILL